MQINQRKKIRMNGMQILALGFFVTILIGGIILSLPISSSNGEPTRFIDSLFTSTSAVCVTGLVILDTGTHWNTFGQTIIMLLIEIGGLGFMTIATLIFVVLGKKITLKERLVLQNAINAFDIQGIVRMVRYIILFTIAAEGLGAILFAFSFVPEYGWPKGIFYSIFHSISAFCNAGFDIIGNGVSLTTHNTDRIVILVASALIITGGLGFAVWSELINIRKLKRMSLHTKMVILMTTILVVGGSVLMFLFEHNNPETLQNMKFIDKVTNSIFAAVTPRTAGFNSISTSGMTMAGQFLTMILMIIGGSPGSTAGGVKTTTIGILLLTVFSVIKGREDTEVFKRRISKDIVYKSVTLVFIASLAIIIVTMILSHTEQGVTFIELLYESTSALSTAGLSLGITSSLSEIGKLLIISMMYIGRVGPITVVLALTRESGSNGVRYPEGKILIG